MSKKFFFIVAGLFLFPTFAFANDAFDLIDTGVNALSASIPLLISLAILVFFWGIVKFINHAGDEKAVEEGRQLIVWGLIGIFVIVGMWSIVGYIQGSLGIDFSGSSGDIPSIPTTVP